MAEFNSPFSPFGAPKPEEELLYPEQGVQFVEDEYNFSVSGPSGIDFYTY